MSNAVKKTLRVAVLMGGPACEHAISVASGVQVTRALTTLGHTAVPILISPQQTWHLLDPVKLLTTSASLEKTSDTSLALLSDSRALASFSGVQTEGVDLVFIAMHGPYGEDGKIQALLELLGLPYTGSGVLASALSMDKVQFRRVMRAEGILVPEYAVVTDESMDEIEQICRLTLGGPPLVVKPSDQGSSIGVSLVKSWDQLAAAVTLARSSSSVTLVDRFIKGRELTVGIIGSSSPRALPIVEIIPDGEFFDYKAKYLSKKTKEICPADLDENIAQELQQIAIQVYRTVGAKGFGRVDFILDEHNLGYVLEINTIPGLTEASLLPKAAVAAGMSQAELIQAVISDAVELVAK